MKHKNVYLSNAFILATLVAKGFEKNVGPFGGEDPEIDEDEDGTYLTLTSQGPDNVFRFNNDGSVDEHWDWYDEDDAVEDLTEVGFEEEEAREWYRDGPAHFDSVMDLLDRSDDRTTWFMYFQSDHPELYNIIKSFVELIQKKKKEK